MSDPSIEPIQEEPTEALPPEASAGPKPRISIHSILWPLFLSLGVLAVIGYFTFEPASFRDLLRDLNPWWLAAACGTVVLRVLFGGWRLDYFSHGRLGFLGGLRGQLAWDFFSNVTPSTIGGGPIAAAFIARDRRLPLGEATSIMLFSMLMDQIWFALSIPGVLACAMYLEVIPLSLGSVGFWSFTLYFLGFMVWVIVFGYATLYRPQLLEKVVSRVFRFRLLQRFRDGALDVMTQLRYRAKILRSQPRRFYLKGFVLTLVPWFSRYFLAVFIIWSVYPQLDVVLVFLRTVALNLGSVVLPTPGGAGGLEGLYALLLGPPLIPQALVAPTLLVWRLLGYYVFIAAGSFITMYHMQRTIRRNKGGAETLPAGSSNGTPALPEQEAPVQRSDRT